MEDNNNNNNNNNQNNSNYRELGNKYFKENRINLALDSYNKAIEVDSKDYQSFTNRSLIYYQKKEFQLSLLDAVESIRINPVWWKGYFRKSLALKQLNKFDESLRSLYILYNNKDQLSQSNVDLNLIKKEIDTIQKLLITKRYSAQILSSSETFPNSTSNVKVDYINADLGKSVFLLKDITNNQAFSPIISEFPLVSNIDPIYYNNNNYRFCHHCLKLIHLDKSQYNSFINNNFNFKDNNQFPTCQNHCKFEIYCSDKCKDIAWNQYHNILCSDYESVLKLYDYCRSKNQIFPIIIMKMIAIIMSDIKNNEKSLDDALLPFTAFTFDLSDSSLNDVQKTSLSIITEIFKQFNNKIDINNFNALINNERYHQFNSILKLNSSNVEPISILEEYIDNLVSKTPLNQDFILIEPSGLKIPINDIGNFISNNKQSSQSIKGVGLYRIINSCNHSCEPNVQSAFNQNNHSMSLFPVVERLPLKRNQELNISYINEDLPFDQRQILLKDNYLFTCNCKKCKSKK